jgi:hypothetical protein
MNRQIIPTEQKSLLSNDETDKNLRYFVAIIMFLERLYHLNARLENYNLYKNSIMRNIEKLEEVEVL